VGRYRDEITQSSAYKKVLDQHAKNEESVQALANSINQLQVEVDRMRSSIAATNSDEPAQAMADLKQAARPVLEHSILDPSINRSSPAGEIDFRVTYPPAFGAEILQSGKEDLLKRLEPDPDRPAALTSDVASPTSPPPEDDDADDDYDDASDEGHGLLTDVPLILGPTEIEVLPMIIMAGIVEPTEGQPGYHSDPTVFSSIRSMHSVRCHLLLAQDNGRNLLRELLIFVAAWDLREEELYFKFMVKIMEAILANGLLPFAYHAFRESEYVCFCPSKNLAHRRSRSKDIISPAQAVIMKLLTNIFRARQARTPSKALIKPSPTPVDQGDAHMVNFLLTEFRRHIIPQTCALIFLQGQIRAGHAQPEDFPLNLWDMERMYEGVYQYLEFFAILTEHETWKTMLSNWEVANELVTLLKELDAAIPKGQISVPPLTTAARQPTPAPPAETDGPQPVAVERPYDTSNPNAPEGYMPSPRPYIDEAQDEPSEFEWRNLKKLAVLVLSSLVWKNRQVQDQIRPLGGIEAVLNCCSYDEHNPYIREHAIMCLRFLMEGNKENQDHIRALERFEKDKTSGPVEPPPLSAAQQSNKPPVSVKVPDEVLDQQGYETYMDSKGQVMLRKREVKPPVVGNIGKGKAKLETRDPKDLEQLVQQVMRELPTRVQGVKHDAEKAAALAKLDREFDGAGKG
jgi:palmitoyltransferase